MTDVPIVKSLIKGKWLISNSKAFDLDIVCPNKATQKSSTVVIHRGVHVMDIQPQCIGHSVYFSLPHYLNHDSAFRLRETTSKTNILRCLCVS